MEAQRAGAERSNAPRIVTILSGNDEQDESTWTALGRALGSSWYGSATRKRRSRTSPPPEPIWWCSTPMRPPRPTRSLPTWPASRRRPALLILLSECREPSDLYGADSGIEHYLCRPFLDATLVALSRSILDGVTGN